MTATVGADAAGFVELDVGVGAWAGLLGLIVVLVVVDLVRHRDDHEPTPRQAMAESVVWVTCGLASAGLVAIAFGGRAAGEYLAGYQIEKSLSVDNVFVWSVLVSALAQPLRYQHRVLFWGIFGALALRFTFIVTGAALIERFSWLLVVFGALLVGTGVRVLRHRDDEGRATATRGIGVVRRFVPVTDGFDGHALEIHHRRHPGESPGAAPSPAGPPPAGRTR